MSKAYGLGRLGGGTKVVLRCSRCSSGRHRLGRCRPRGTGSHVLARECPDTHHITGAILFCPRAGSARCRCSLRGIVGPNPVPAPRVQRREGDEEQALDVEHQPPKLDVPRRGRNALQLRVLHVLVHAPRRNEDPTPRAVREFSDPDPSHTAAWYLGNGGCEPYANAASALRADGNGSTIRFGCADTPADAYLGHELTHAMGAYHSGAQADLMDVRTQDGPLSAHVWGGSGGDGGDTPSPGPRPIRTNGQEPALLPRARRGDAVLHLCGS